MKRMAIGFLIVSMLVGIALCMTFIAWLVVVYGMVVPAVIIFGIASCYLLGVMLEDKFTNTPWD